MRFTALVELGFDGVHVQNAAEQVPRAAVMDVTLQSGERLRVDAFGRDQRDGQLAARIWRRIMYREPGQAVFGSRLQEVEHIAYTLLLPGQAQVHAPVVVKTGTAGPDAAILVTRPPDGQPLDTMPTERVTDGVLNAIWGQVQRLSTRPGSRMATSAPTRSWSARDPASRSMGSTGPPRTRWRTGETGTPRPS